MNADEYYIPEDDDDQAAADLAEYEMYVHEQNRKARALLARQDALEIAQPFAEELTKLVQQHAKLDGATTLADVLRDTVAEFVFANAVQENVLQRPFSRAGFIAVRKTRDDACAAFEALLAAEASQ